MSMMQQCEQLQKKKKKKKKKKQKSDRVETQSKVKETSKMS